MIMRQDFERHNDLEEYRIRSRNRFRNRGRRKLACFHEAGHCLARWYLGYFTDSVEVLTLEQLFNREKLVNRRGIPIEGEGLVSGYSIAAHRTYEQLLKAGESPDLKDQFLREAKISNEKAMIETVAGVLAEARYRKESSWRVSSRAGPWIWRTWNTLRTFGRPRRKGKLAKRKAWDRAGALVRSPEGWAAITAMAKALHERGRLEDEEIEELCRDAYGGRQPEFGCWHQHWPPSLEMIRSGFIPDP